MEYAKRVENLYAALERRDTEYVLNQVDDDIEWVVFGPPSVPFSGAHYGREAVRRLCSIIHSTQRDSRVTITEIISPGKTVVATVRFSGRVVSTGRCFESSAVHLFTFRGGRIASCREYFDTAALAAAYAPAARSAAA